MSFIVRIALLFLLMFSIAACAMLDDITEKQGKRISLEAEDKTPSKGASERTVQRGNPVPDDLKLVDVQSEIDNEVKVVKVVANAPFNYIVYMLEMPRRLAIELPDMANGLDTSLIKSKGDLISKINVVEFEKANALRLEIYLRHPVFYDLTETGASASLAIIKSDVGGDVEALTTKLKEKTRQIKKLAVENKKLKERVRELEDKLGVAMPVNNKPGAGKLSSAASDEDKVALAEIIGRWKTAWQDRDFGAYSSCYSDVYVPVGRNRDDWKRSKIKMFNKAKSIEVDVDELDIDINGARAKVRFLQKYRSDRYSDIGYKTMGLEKTDAGWRIVSETWKRAR